MTDCLEGNRHTGNCTCFDNKILIEEGDLISSRKGRYPNKIGEMCLNNQ